MKRMMRTLTLSLLAIVLLVAWAAVAFGQAQRAPRMERGAAPTDKATFFSGSDLKADVRSQVAKAVSNSIGLMEGGHFSLNLVHRVGKEEPQWHQEEVDLYIIQEGTATIVTGGELVGPITTAPDGDKRGTAIRGGESRVVGPGDVVFIPPGVPHQGVFHDARGITYLNIHFPGRWPERK